MVKSDEDTGRKEQLEKENIGHNNGNFTAALRLPWFTIAMVFIVALGLGQIGIRAIMRIQAKGFDFDKLNEKGVNEIRRVTPLFKSNVGRTKTTSNTVAFPANDVTLSNKTNDRTILS